MQTFRRAFLLATAGIVAISAVITVRAQALETTLPAFEVASVKMNKSGESQMSMNILPEGRFTAINMPLKQSIAIAYGMPQPLQLFRVVRGPRWIESDRFDIIVKAPPDTDSDVKGVPRQLTLRLRTLMADRFKLVVHDETRQLPIYALVLARQDRQLGPRLRPTNVDCEALNVARKAVVVVHHPCKENGRSAGDLRERTVSSLGRTA
jgi:uncharacterized protein (TIGR03435 family)